MGRSCGRINMLPGGKIMTEQNEDTRRRQATLKLPEGEAIVSLPAALSVASAQKLSIWLQVAGNLEGVEIKE